MPNPINDIRTLTVPFVEVVADLSPQQGSAGEDATWTQVIDVPWEYSDDAEL